MDQIKFELILKEKLQIILGINTHNLDPEQRLIDVGLDSYGFVELITEIERTFDIVLNEEDILGNNFTSINKIVALIKLKKE
jgi:acyl carrier protein